MTTWGAAGRAGYSTSSPSADRGRCAAGPAAAARTTETTRNTARIAATGTANWRPATTSRTSSTAPTSVSGQRREPDDEQPVPDLHRRRLDTAAEQHAVDRRRRDQQPGGDRGQQQRDDVGPPLHVVDAGEPFGERQREQEREQDLHARLRDPQLLEHLDHVAVGPLQGPLVVAILDAAVLAILVGPARRRSRARPRPSRPPAASRIHLWISALLRCGVDPSDTHQAVARRSLPRSALSANSSTIFAQNASQVAGVAAGHQPLVGDDLLVDHLGAGVAQVRCAGSGTR